VLRLLACCLPTTWGTSPTPAVRTYDGPHDDAQVAELAGPIRKAVDGGALVLALTPSDDEGLFERLVVLRTALNTTGLVVHRTSLPPLAYTALVRALDELANEPRLPASVVAVSTSVLASPVAAICRGSLPVRCRHRSR
jgi:hypothetical protein